MERIAGFVARLERSPRSALIVAALATAIVIALWPSDRPIAIATFNIENFPRSEVQVDRAFALIDEMDVALVAVQEIRDPDRFAREARARLGDEWRFVHADGPHPQQVGILYDGERLALDWARTHRSTLIGRRAKPALEARFEGGLRVFVVHLTSGAHRVERRRAQLAAIEPAIRAAVASGDRVALLGDFNASQPEDRDAIAGTAERTGLAWISRELACTSYWKRSEGGCVGTPLDHVLLWQAAEIEARGACAEDGCERRDRCPEYCASVSDHCPVRVALP